MIKNLRMTAVALMALGALAGCTTKATERAEAAATRSEDAARRAEAAASRVEAAAARAERAAEGSGRGRGLNK